jgi:DNA ligase-1
MVFDSPKMKEPFHKRLDKIRNRLEALYKECPEAAKYVVLHEHKVCEGYPELMTELDRVCDAGGEGVMLREPNSPYENRRSDMLLKVKKFEDAEASVTGHERGTGRCSGMLGAIHVRGDDGTEFKIGSGFTDAQRMKPPKIGSRVTYKYMGKSDSGKPRFPIFMRVHPGM